MRVLLQSNAPWVPTGYGTIAKNLIHRWKAMGHDVAVFCFNGLYGGQLVLDGIPMFPLGKDLWGKDKVEAYYRLFNADIYITNFDVWAMPEMARMNVRWVPYVPVDHEPCPEPVLEALKGAYRVASYSESASKLLSDGGIESVPISVGVDTKIFKPNEKREELRKRAGYSPDDFVVGIMAMNKGQRKNFPEMFDAFSRFKKRHPNAKLFAHTDPLRPDGINLIKVAERYGIINDIILSDVTMLELGYPTEMIADMYNTFDVLLMTTAGEGFGMPIIEAQACGVPVITNNFTTGKELNAHPELVVEPRSKFMDALVSFQAETDVEKAVEALETVYMKPRGHYKDSSVKYVQKYDWDVVAKGWEKFFNEIEADLGIKKVEQGKADKQPTKQE